ncbi:hypothetical protein [Candidatus Nitrospira neomarina]|uniref:Uncharacterized protein n=1 Tax=Candidatus Nitrospira neomarina TaxID=3020899 RepID=A0AA96JYN8_9BACT|nr:hypothetical protein [Candidatus Nitrospira neomarina]WNM60316.1 hypothetical protein PQG83_11135 [Candidatus Nitrospira neomarina]
MIVWIWATVLFLCEVGLSRSEGGLKNESFSEVENLNPIQKENINVPLAYTYKPWVAGHVFFADGEVASSPQPSPDFSSKRTGSALVGSVMALLATFESANVLPPEGTSQANQLIHGLIQMQSALVKSQSSELSEYVSAAVKQRFEKESAELLESMHQSGLTSKLLESLVSYNHKIPMWEKPALIELFQRYNISRQDWELIEKIFREAEVAYRIKGSSIHDAYELWRAQMPGGRS